MSDCDHNCADCNEKNCKERDLRAPQNEQSKIKHVLAVASGKGGVGKSTVTACLAAAVEALGKKTAILDADITGPSIPTAFGIHERALGGGGGIVPAKSKSGLKLMSLNLLAENETDPVIWRGPLVSGVVKQFWTDVNWGDIDFMFVDMPPGTGDVALTVFQSLPIEGVIIVTSPQDLVSMIVTKAVNMAKMMNIPVMGLIENYSYFKCPDCGKTHFLFGESKLDETAFKLNLPVLAKLPINPKIASAFDAGKIEETTENPLEELARKLVLNFS